MKFIMELTWRYVIKIKDEKAFTDFEKEYGVEVPRELKNLIMEVNSGTPSKVRIRDEQGNERVFGGLLSYNKEDVDNVFKAMKHEQHRGFLPFAVDPFGNYFAINMMFGDVVWEDHETNTQINIANSLEEMLNNLY